MGFFENNKIFRAIGAGLSGAADAKKANGMPKIRSISSAANVATFVYPVLIDNGIARADGEDIRKGLEMNYANFTKVMTSLQPAIKLNASMPDVSEYLQKFHKDLGFSSKEEVLGLLERLQESGSTDLFEKSLNLARLPGSLQRSILSESSGWSYEERDGSENADPEAAEERRKNNRDIREGKKDKRDQEKHDEDLARQKRQEKRQKRQDGAAYKQQKEKNDLEKMKQEQMAQSDNRRAAQDAYKEFENMSNASLPTTITAKVQIIRDDSDNAAPIETHVPIHIKAYARSINTRTFEEELIKCLNNKGGVFKFIKWISGEKGTLKDTIIGVNDIKEEAIKAARNGDTISSVKRYKRLAKISIGKLMKGLLPQTSFVISMDLAERVRIATGKDLTNTKVAQKLIKDFHLLSFVVTDGEMAYVTFDGRSYTDEIPLSALRRAQGKSDNLNEVLKLFRMMK